MIGGLVGHYYLIVGLPATPMSVSRANRLFRDGVQPGQSRAEVEAWLVSQGIPQRQGLFDTNVCYSVLHRREDVTFKGWWMACRGNQTVAECAGLDIDTVYSVVSVIYPEADRFLLGHTELTVCLSFDRQERLIRHWVDEFHFSL
jgi:hypothetical protein